MAIRSRSSERVVATNGLTPSQELVEDHSEREHVGAAIDQVTLAAGQLGAHVGGSAQHAGTRAEILRP